MELAEARGRMDLVENAGNRRVVYVVIAAIATLISFLFSKGSGIDLIGVFLALAYLVVLVLILHLIHRVKSELVDGPSI